MSFITVGYTDKVNRRNPIKPPGSSIADIFSSNYEQPEPNVKKSNKIEEKSVISSNESKSHANGHTETKICEQIQTLTVEENSNEIKRTETTNKSVEVNTTISGVEIKQEANGNAEKKNNICTKPIEPVEKVPNNVFTGEENDYGIPQRRTRVPPGGYSSGLW